jgi:hypothetical protein
VAMIYVGGGFIDACVCEGIILNGGRVELYEAKEDQAGSRGAVGARLSLCRAKERGRRGEERRNAADGVFVVGG